MNRVALAQGLAWLLVPVIAGAARAEVAPVRAKLGVPCTADEIAFAARLRALEEIVARSGSGQRMVDGGLVLKFAAREGLRAEIARWILDVGARHRSAEWRLTRNRQGDVVLAVQCSGDVLAFVCAHVPSIARLPRI